MTISFTKILKALLRKSAIRILIVRIAHLTMDRHIHITHRLDVIGGKDDEGERKRQRKKKQEKKSCFCALNIFFSLLLSFRLLCFIVSSFVCASVNELNSYNILTAGVTISKSIE